MKRNDDGFALCCSLYYALIPALAIVDLERLANEINEYAIDIMGVALFDLSGVNKGAARFPSQFPEPSARLPTRGAAPAKLRRDYERPQERQDDRSFRSIPAHWNRITYPGNSTAPKSNREYLRVRDALILL